MAFCTDGIADLVRWPTSDRPGWPWAVTARLGDLRPRFLAKGGGGRGHRYVARNGRVLLAAERPLDELIHRTVRLRFQTWHRPLLAGDLPEPFGVLLAVRPPEGDGTPPQFTAELTSGAAESAALALDVGGGSYLLLLSTE